MQHQTIKESESEDLLSSSEEYERKEPEYPSVKVEVVKKERIDEDAPSRFEKPRQKKKPAKKAKKAKARKAVKMDYFYDEAKEASSEEYSKEEVKDYDEYLLDSLPKIQPKEYISSILKREQSHWLAQFQDKTEEEINRMFEERYYREVDANIQFPGTGDPRIYSVKVKGKKQAEICLELLSKFVKRVSKGVVKTQSGITSVFYLKEKYEHYIFVEGFSVDKVCSGLKGTMGIMLSTLAPIQGEEYAKILVRPKLQLCGIKKGNYVRVKVGLYEGDLGRVTRTGKNNLQLALVPRISLDLTKTKEYVKRSGSTEVNISIPTPPDYLKKIGWEQRPSKNLITDQLSIDILKPYFRFSHKGFVLLKYRLEDITEDIGALTPKEISYFQENTSIQEFVEKEQSNLLVKASVREGQLVKCLAGDGMGLTGRVKRIQDDMVTFDSFSHGKFVAEVTEHLSNICPVFKKGDQVLVGSGLDVGKEGVVVDVADRHTTILTKNDNQLTVLTKLLTHRVEGIGLQPPTMYLHKYDLVRYQHGVGMVLSWDWTIIKLLSQHGKIECVTPLELDETVKKSESHFTINAFNEKILVGSSVQLVAGKFKGKICDVKRIHQSTVFVFNKDFVDEGIQVLPVNELRLVTTGANLGVIRQTQEEREHEKQLIGKIVTIRSGYYKGLQGNVRRVVKGLVRIKLNTTIQTVEIPITCVPEVEKIVGDLEAEAKMIRRAASTYRAPFEESKTSSFGNKFEAKVDEASPSESSDED